MAKNKNNNRKGKGQSKGKGKAPKQKRSKGNDSSASVQGTASEFDGGDERGGQRESVGPTVSQGWHNTEI